MTTIPTQLGPYTIDREIGRGGMGVVYLGRDTKLDRAVAIKSLPEHVAQDPDRLARFEREARTLASLTHPNVAGIYGVEEADGAKYLILEYVEGETLAERLDRGPLDVDEALEVCVQIALGVEAAHEAGVIHRDLKPANVKITPDGKVKVLDFGLAKVEEGASSIGSTTSQSPTLTTPARHTPTVPGAILGTAAYMSPEQARGRSVDSRADIWSYGVVLYECLTGASPFVGETVRDSIGAILHKDVDLDRLPSDTPRMVRHVLVRCLERDKSKRLRDIGDARLELELVRSGDASRDLATGRHTGRHHSWGLTAGVAITVAAIASAAVWVLASRPVQSKPEVVRFSLPFADRIDQSGLAFQTLAISPDGSTIVHSAGRSGRTQLYMKRLDETEPRAIPGTDGGRSPFFSIDGERLGFMAAGELKWLALSGGAPLTVTSFPGLQYGAEWLPDGSMVYATSQNETLLIVSASGGTPRNLETDWELNAIGAFRWPHMLPDGQHLLVTFVNSIDGVSGPHIVAINIDSGKTKAIARGADARFIEPDILVFLQGETMLASRFDVRSLDLMGQPRSIDLLPLSDGFGSVWVAIASNGTIVYVPAGGVGGNGRLVWVDREGRTTPVSSETGKYFAPRLSPEESKIAYWTSGDAIDVGIFVHDIRQGRSFPIELLGTNGGSYPIWSRNGRSVQALCNVPGTGWTWQSARADGSGTPEILLNLDTARLTTSLDPHGEGGIGYEVNPVTNRDIWRIESFDIMTPLVATPANERAPRISPDGRWFAFVSDRTGQDEVYVSSYPEGDGLILVSINGGVEPVWSHDGTELFYRIDESLMATTVGEGDEFNWSRPTELFSGRFMQDFFGNANYDVSADGLRFLMVQTEAEEEWEMRVVLNWTAELKELLPDR